MTLLCLISISGVKHLPALLAKKFQRRPPIFCTFSIEPLVIYNCALYNIYWKLSLRLRDIRLLSIPWPWNPGQGSLKVIENYTTRSGTYHFLLTFHSNHRPISHCFRDKRQYPSKIADFSHPRVLNAPDKGVPLGIWYRRKGPECFCDGAIRWSKKF